MKSKNNNIFINKTSKVFFERGFEAILAIVLGIASLGLLLLFPIMGIALAVFASCFLCVGIKRYLIGISQNEFLPIESIFDTFSICIKAFCLKIAVTLITFLWGVIFIIPGIVSALNYSMVSFVLAQDNDLSTLECMAKSKEIVYGYRFEILVIYLCYFLVTIISLCIFGAIGIAVQYYTNIPVWIPMVLMGLLFLFTLIILIIPYFELTFANIYLELTQKSLKPTGRVSKSTKTSAKTNIENKKD